MVKGTKNKQQDDSKARQKDAVKRLFSYVLQYKKRIAIAFCAMIVNAGASSLIAILVGQLTDKGFYEKDPNAIWWAPGALLAISLAYGVASFVSAYYLQSISQSVLFNFRNALFSRVLRWPAEVYQRRNSGLVMTTFLNQAGTALGGAMELIATIFRDSLQIIALLCVLFYHNWQLSLVSFVVAPFLALIIRWVSKRTRRYAGGFQEALADLANVIREGYSGQRMVKIYGAYDYEEERFTKFNGKMKKLALRRKAVSASGTPMTHFVSMCAVSIVVVVALLQAQHGMLSLGEFITFLSALLLLMTPIRHLSSLNGSTAAMSVAAESIFEMLDEAEEADPGQTELKKTRGDVRFERVSHQYVGADRPSVQNFTLDVKAGETVALVGASGAGKTTLINLIPRFWVPTSGEIYFDGVAQSSVTLKSLREQISLVSQDVVLFDDTIAANIAYGNEKATREEIEAAAKKASCHDFIAALPEGYDTLAGDAGSHLSGGERQRIAGSKLSGGQKQRISIARALLKDAPILLLDEATSALDTESEKYIQQSLDELMKGRTTFVVAHRLSTIIGADKIVVMKDGQIQEVGKHQELLDKKGLYAHLYSIQFATPHHE